MSEKSILRATPATRKARKTFNALNVGVHRARCERCGLSVYISQAAFSTLERRREEGEETDVVCTNCLPDDEAEMMPERQEPEIRDAEDKLVKRFEVEVRRN